MKIDVSKITGFDEMTADEKLAALLKLDVPDEVDMSKFVAKETADKYASEAAELKKQLRTKQTEDEIKKDEDEKSRKELEDKYNELLARTTIAENKAKYLSLGYEDKLAADTAKALFEGDMEKVFANGAKHQAELEKRIKADVLRGTPKPEGAGSGSESLTKEQFNAMGYTQRVNLRRENQELYEKMMKEGNE